MAIRITDTEVKEIIELEDTIVLTPFIAVASSLVDKIELKDTSDSLIGGTNVILSQDDLKEIERWLSAHFSAIMDMRAETEKAGTVSVTYQSKLDIGFDVTMYGQMAKRLDLTGYLSSLDRKAMQECNKCTTDDSVDNYVCMEAL